VTPRAPDHRQGGDACDLGERIDGEPERWLAIAGRAGNGPYTPRTNGKAERFIQTALRVWAYAKA
jgi:hypothetical protein